MSDFRKEKQFMKRRWKDVRVGDFVKVVCNEVVPADLLLLHTSDPNGVCHIETSNLDGETNLKQRKAMSGLCISVRNTYYFHFSPIFFTVFYPSSLPHLSPPTCDLTHINRTAVPCHYLLNTYGNYK